MELEEFALRNMGKFVVIGWLDACYRNGQTKEDLAESSPKDLLIITESIGKIIGADDKAISIAHIINELTSDVSSIPFGMIKSIRILK